MGDDDVDAKDDFVIDIGNANEDGISGDNADDEDYNEVDDNDKIKNFEPATPRNIWCHVYLHSSQATISSPLVLCSPCNHLICKKFLHLSLSSHCLNIGGKIGKTDGHMAELLQRDPQLLFPSIGHNRAYWKSYEGV